MRWLISISLIALLLLGCSTTPQQPTGGMVSKTTPGEAGKSIALLAKESILFADGALDEYRVFSYQEQGTRPLREELFNVDEELLEEITYEYAGDLLRKKLIYDSMQILNSYREFTYNDQGLVASDTLYDSNDEAQTASVYEYDSSGQVLKWSIYDHAKALLGYTTYTYEQGRQVKVEIFNPTGGLEKFTVTKYNGGADPVSESTFNAPQTLEKYTQYEYSNQHLMGERHFDAKKRLLREVKYEYDQQGNITRVIHLDRKGDIREIRQREYIYRDAEPGTP